MKSFSISQAIGKGWQLTTANLGFLLGVMVVAFVVPQIVQSVLINEMNPGLFGGLITLAAMAYSFIVAMGLYKVSLMLVDGQKPQFNDLFSQYPKLINYFVAGLLFILGVALGSILLIIPGIWFALRYQYFGMAIVDKNMGPIEALKYSGQITQGNALKLFGMALASMGVIVLGLLALILGVFVAMPVVYLAMAYIYRTLSK